MTKILDWLKANKAAVAAVATGGMAVYYFLSGDSAHGVAAAITALGFLGVHVDLPG